MENMIVEVMRVVKKISYEDTWKILLLFYVITLMIK